MAYSTYSQKDLNYVDGTYLNWYKSWQFLNKFTHHEAQYLQMNLFL